MTQITLALTKGRILKETLPLLDQAGIDTSILKSNLTLIIGSILLSFTIAFGLGSGDVIKRLLFGYYSRKNFQIGERIKVKDIEGVIVSIDNICIVVLTAEGKVVFPVKEIVDEIIIIKESE